MVNEYNFKIKSSIKDYDVGFDKIGNIKYTSSDFFIIDHFVWNNYDIPIDKEDVLIIESSEKQKEYSSIQVILNRLIERGFKRDGKIIAIGGGVIQDITGFVSSIIYRGVQWEFYPTTLLSQGDSCIGSKTSINVGDYKNMVGNFYPPSKVVIDINFLNKLPESQIYSGIGEMIHYFLIDGMESFEFISNNYHNKNSYLDIIHKSLGIKKKMIEIDEFDRKERKVFNYGHTFGHAIETITDYKIPHGISVCYGMSISNYVSFKLGYLSKKEMVMMETLLSKIYSFIDLPDFDINEYMELLKKDKKNIGENIGLILTKGIGNMFIEQVSPNKVYKYIEDKVDKLKIN